MNKITIRLLVFTIAIGSLLFYLHKPLWGAFQHNFLLNTVILGILAFGIVYNFLHLYKIHQEYQWLEDKSQRDSSLSKKPNILSPLALYFENNSPSSMTILSARSVLSSIQDRLDGLREVSRYLMGVVIFLGLLGTFWGLSQTIGAIANVISGLDIGSTSESKDAFAILKEGLRSPLTGMGTAFSCSLFGLMSSLIIGFFDLQIGKCFDEFYYYIEEELTALTGHNSDKSVNSLIPHHGPAYTGSLVEQMAEQMTSLVHYLQRQEDQKNSNVKLMTSLTEKIGSLTDYLNQTQSINRKSTQIQASFVDSIDGLIKVISQPGFGVDDSVRQSLRSIEAIMLRNLEDDGNMRKQLANEIKGELRLIAKTISSLGMEGEIRQKKAN